ncbi:MAG: NUDIX hydrolase [Ornithinimicrobium sp.]
MSTTHRDFDLDRGTLAPAAEAARRWLETPPEARTTTRPRLAASVLLLRDGPSGIEVFMQQRVPSMAFAAGMWVYPGGSVDPSDTVDLPDGADNVRGKVVDILRRAVVREVFEECGVLFAGLGSDDLLEDLSAECWGSYRAALVARSISFAEMLRREGLVVRSDLLQPVGRWVTPECEPRRYDTTFWAATVPPGQEADGRTTEASRSEWVAASAAVRRHSQGPAMMPPTVVLAEQVARCATVADYLATPRTVTAVRPEPVLRTGEPGGRVVMRAPIDEHGNALDGQALAPRAAD